MATRPVFFPTEKGPHLVRERHFDFRWSSGFAEVQKKKNVRALHDAAHREGIDDLLEISSKSDEELGRKLSAFSLKVDVDGKMLPPPPRPAPAQSSRHRPSKAEQQRESDREREQEGKEAPYIRRGEMTYVL